MKYRKKPVVIEALPVKLALYYAAKEWRNLPQWLKDSYEKGKVIFGNTAVYLNTLEGQMTANLDDMIICGVQGELYPCKPDIFEATYEKVEV